MSIYIRRREDKIEMINPENGKITEITPKLLSALEKSIPSRLYWL